MGNSYHDLRRAQPGQLPVALRARLAVDAVAGEPVKLQYTDGLDRGELAELVEAWPARADGTLPQLGDLCLVLFDDAGRPWVVAWLDPGF